MLELDLLLELLVEQIQQEQNQLNLVSSLQMRQHLLYPLLRLLRYYRVEHLWHLLDKVAWQHNPLLTSRNRQLPYLFRLQQEHLRAQLRLPLSYSIFECFPIAHFSNFIVYLTFSIVGDRLGISSLIWSG